MAEKDNPTVNLSKETRRDIASAIRDLSRQFRETRDEAKTRSFADNIAHNLASGGSVRESMTEAVSVSAERGREAFKKAIDPVQIVKRLTGGSKLASVLAGRALGRSQARIRGGADIHHPITTAPSTDTSPSAFQEPSHSPTQLSGDKTQTVLSDMLKYMGMITLQVTSIADKMGAHGVARNKKGQFTEMAAPQYRMLKEIKNLLILDHKEDKVYQKRSLDVELEQQRLLRESEELRRQAAIDAELEADLLRAQQYKARFGHSPRQLNGMGLPMGGHGSGGSGDSGGGGGGGGGGGFMKPLFGALAGILGIEGMLHGKGLVKAGIKLGGSALNALKHPFKTTGALIKGAGAVITKPLESIKSGVSAIKSFAGVGDDAAKAVAPGASKLITAGAEGTGHRLTGTLAQRLEALGASAAPKAVVPLATEAAAAGASAAPKAAGPLAKLVKGGKKAAIAGKSAISALVKKMMPAMMAKYGGKLAGSAIPGLGSLIGMGMTAKSLWDGDLVGAGINAVGMIPYAGLATIPAMIARDIYKDAYDGADPFTDPKVSERMPELVAAVRQQVGDWISGKEESPTQVAEAVADEEGLGTSPTAVPMGVDSGDGTSPTAVPMGVDSGDGTMLGPAPMSSEEADLMEMIPPGHVAGPPKFASDNIERLSREVSTSPRAAALKDSSSSPMVISNSPTTNISNQITQKMTSPRNTESSFLTRQYLAGVPN